VLGRPNNIFFAEDPDGSLGQDEPNWECWEVAPDVYEDFIPRKMEWMQSP
jgi:hypothetical protein